jgi:hypothetical protein
MFLECVSSDRAPYLRVAETYSVKENGKTKVKKRIVKNVGPLSRFDDGQPDFLDRLRVSFKSGTPLIEELTDLAQGNPTRNFITCQFDLRDKGNCFSQPKNIGYFFLDSLYDRLGIYDVLNRYKSNNHVPYDLNGLAKLLVFGRVLFPDSKMGTFEERDKYVFPITRSNNLHEVYQTLDCLNNCADTIQKRMNYKITNGKTGRNTEVCFYDVTNYTVIPPKIVVET